MPYVTNSTFHLSQSTSKGSSTSFYLQTPTPPQEPTLLSNRLTSHGAPEGQCHPSRLETLSKASPLCVPLLEKGPNWPDVASASPGKDGY